MRRSSIIAAVALVLLGGTTAPAAAGDGGRGRPATAVYLALGDSAAAGAAPPAHEVAPGYVDLLADLLEDGYHPAADKAVPRASVDVEVRELAVPGSTTAGVIADQLPEAVQLLRERNHDAEPFNDIEVVTLTIGGNDVVRPAIGACILVAPSAGCQAAVNTALATAAAGVTRILEELVSAAGRHTEVVVTTYYNPIGGNCVLAQQNPLAEQIADVVLNGGTFHPEFLTLEDGLNDVIREAAEVSGAQVADLSGVDDRDFFVGGQDCLHANVAGNEVIAGIIYDTLAAAPAR